MGLWTKFTWVHSWTACGRLPKSRTASSAPVAFRRWPELSCISRPFLVDGRAQESTGASRVAGAIDGQSLWSTTRWQRIMNPRSERSPSGYVTNYHRRPNGQSGLGKRGCWEGGTSESEGPEGQRSERWLNDKKKKKARRKPRAKRLTTSVRVYRWCVIYFY